MSRIRRNVNRALPLDMDKLFLRSLIDQQQTAHEVDRRRPDRSQSTLILATIPVTISQTNSSHPSYSADPPPYHMWPGFSPLPLHFQHRQYRCSQEADGTSEKGRVVESVLRTLGEPLVHNWQSEEVGDLKNGCNNREDEVCIEAPNKYDTDLYATQTR